MRSTESPETAALAARMRLTLGQLHRRLREHAQKGELTWSQTAVLGRLDRDGPSTVTALARAEGVKSQSMGAIVAALEAQGLVCGAPDPEDGRQTILSPTDLCREFLAQSRAARDDWLSHTLQARLSAGEHQKLEEALELIARLIEP